MPVLGFGFREDALDTLFEVVAGGDSSRLAGRGGVMVVDLDSRLVESDLRRRLYTSVRG